MGLRIRYNQNDANTLAVKTDLNDIVRDAREAWRIAVYLLSNDIMDAAEPLVPKSTGALWDSRFILKGKVTVMGFAAEHALFVHEIDKDYNNGRWKYLQTAVEQMIGKANPLLQQYFNAYLGTGARLSAIKGRHPSRVRGRRKRDFLHKSRKKRRRRRRRG